MREKACVRIAVQSSWRLSERSLELFTRCGFEFDKRKRQLTWKAIGFPLEVMFIRHGDIPEYLIDGVCELAMVGTNALEEALLGAQLDPEGERGAQVLLPLGFGQCRLSLAMPRDAPYEGPASLAGKRLATSYPLLLRRWLDEQGVDAQAVAISGSVELAPSLGIADAISDLVSSGQTLESNGLVEVERVLDCETVLARTKKPVDSEREETIERVLQRVSGVRRASQRKYLMMHAPHAALDELRSLFPGMEQPTILPLGGDSDRYAVHAVTREDVFWETMERLKELGASSILVMPIEKIVD